jgi:hypothetical protein
VLLSLLLLLRSLELTLQFRNPRLQLVSPLLKLCGECRDGGSKDLGSLQHAEQPGHSEGFDFHIDVPFLHLDLGPTHDDIPLHVDIAVRHIDIPQPHIDIASPHIDIPWHPSAGGS